MKRWKEKLEAFVYIFKARVIGIVHKENVIALSSLFSYVVHFVS